MTDAKTYTREDLISLEPGHSSIVCIDSDGCVFDTMEIKQKQCFHPMIMTHWDLWSIEKYLREAAEFVNLYSKTRGRNRFLCLVDTVDLCRERPEVTETGIELPEFNVLRKFIDSGVPLGNPTLKKEVERSGDKELAAVLAWSEAVNARIAEVVRNVPPFKWVSESLDQIRANSDSIVVSQTPVEALVREWTENEIADYASVIAGQELGTKTEHIAMATEGKYEPAAILMIGDAPGDRKAAVANNALFYPVNPAHEEESWERFHKEAYGKFLDGEYQGEYQDKLIADFEALLPETPPWK